MIEIAGVFIWKDRAYLPVLGKTEVHYFHDTGQLLTSELTADALTAALEGIVKLGNPPMRHPTQKEFLKSTPVQKALGMRSLRKMAQAGVIRCGIWWTKSKTILDFSPRGTKDVGEIDSANQKEFPLDVPVRTLAELILQEVAIRRAESNDEPDP